MASLTRTTTAALTAAGLLACGSDAWAQTATQADFEACNRTAQAASIGSGGAASSGSSSGRVRSSAGSPGTNSGTTSSGAAGMPSASPRTSATDTQLTGMDATGHSNAVYQQAYRDCMKQRGF